MAQTLLKTAHFSLYSSPKAVRKGERAIERLEELRVVLPALQGAGWIVGKPLQIWIPATVQDWQRIAASDSEQGVYRSGIRKDWIIVNPEAPNFIEVVSHEYVHAVLDHVRPNLPTWLIEGICEYYSTLELSYRGNRAKVSSGRPPGNRLASLRGLKEIDVASMLGSALDSERYARAWGAAYWLWPDFSGAKSLPNSIPISNFVIRTQTLELRRPAVNLLAVSPAELAEFEVEFAQAGLNERLVAALSGGGKAAQQAQEMFIDGLRLADEGDARRAVPLLAEACRLRPSNSTWWHALALAYRDTDEIDKAREAVNLAVSTAVNESERAAATTLKLALN